MRINILNQTKKHKGKIYDHCKYTQIIIKKFHIYIEKIFCFVKYKNDKFTIR